MAYSGPTSDLPGSEILYLIGADYVITLTRMLEQSKHTQYWVIVEPTLGVCMLCEQHGAASFLTVGLLIINLLCRPNYCGSGNICEV